MPKFYLVDQDSQIYFELCDFIEKGNKLVPGCLVPLSRLAFSQWGMCVIEVDIPERQVDLFEQERNFLKDYVTWGTP